TQGSVSLAQAEDMSWWLGSEAFASGDSVMSDSGNTYILTYGAGGWSAAFRPAQLDIEGTGGLQVFSREADDLWDVESAGSGMTLPASGAGEVTTSAGAMYRVSMTDGMLTGVRFDSKPVGDTVYVTVGLYDGEKSRDAQVSYIGDDRATPFNEANTKLSIAGEEISLGDLLGSGSAMKAAAAADKQPGEFVTEAVEMLGNLLVEAELYARYQADADDDPGRNAFDGRLNSIATRAQDAVDMIFSAGAVDIIDDGTLPVDDTRDDPEDNAFELSGTDYVRATQTVRGLNRLLAALASADAFVDATKKGNNGVFEEALSESDAKKAFSANKSEYTVSLDTTKNTRYGVIALKERKSGTEAAAVHKTQFAFDGSPDEDNDPEFGRIGAFSYATANDTLRARNLLQTGGANYTGGTLAVTPAGTLYSGAMEIDVNFRQQSVFGRVSGLRDKDDNLWQYLGSDVETIFLPRQDYGNLAQFGGRTGPSEDVKRAGTGQFKTATIVYSQSQGFSTTPSEQPTNARFAGRFIGKDGNEITGTWSLGEPVGDDDTKSNDLDVIFGSYGVTRQGGSSPVGPADGTDGGKYRATAVLPMTDDDDNDPLGATFAGNKDTAGILRLGKRSKGGGGNENNDFALTEIFAQPGANPKRTTSNASTHVSVVVDHIKAQRDIYVIYAEQVGGDSTDPNDLANQGRQAAWKSINDFVREHIFDLPITAQGADSNADGSLEAIADADSELADLSAPLGTFMYPQTRTDRPDDGAALERIDMLLAAFADEYAFEAAVKANGGGIFDSRPVLDKDSTAADPFPVSTSNSAAVFKRISSQTKLASLSTDYTRFGVWHRGETASAVDGWDNHASPNDGEDTPTDTGATSPGAYAYSYLEQSAYRVDRPVATYPSNGLATYEGRTLAHTGHSQIYAGDALIRVNWSGLDTSSDTPVATSTIVPIFSNFARVDDSSLDRLIHGGKIVDEIVFRGTSGSGANTEGELLLTHDGEKLGINATTNVVVTVTYTDGTTGPATAFEGETFMGKFVGSSGDGPLGILGTWEVPGFRGDTSVANDLVGSFGADLTDFETPLLTPTP
ncbi:MAG: hypothetical protein OXD30_10240, partial [Bryobacterales bacterium]|nr:hypothetical protein [Bryobacterales bacterium]